MASVPHALKHLHDLHREAQDIRAQLERGPRQVAARRQARESQRKAIETAKEELKRQKADAHAKELQVRTLEDKISGLRIKLNQAASNKEYKALEDQIGVDTKGKGRLEDEVLMSLTTVDEKAAELQNLEADFARLTREFEALEASVTGQVESQRARLSELEAAVAQAEESLPPEMSVAYRRLVAARGADALAGVDGQTCSGCYTSVTPQMHSELLMGRALFCKSCGRMLYLQEA